MSNNYFKMIKYLVDIKIVEVFCVFISLVIVDSGNDSSMNNTISHRECKSQTQQLVHPESQIVTV